MYNNRSPPNGVAVFCGLAATDDGKGREEQVAVVIEPPSPIQTFSYLCDKRFHTEQLQNLLVEEGSERYGFIVTDGHGTLFGLVQGSRRQVLHKFTVDLPNKHGRGGQSATRFEQLRMEARYNYAGKVAELAHKYFAGDGVKGLVVGGLAHFKDVVLKRLSMSLSAIVMAVLDLSESGERGFRQAISLSAETIGSARIIREKRILKNYFEQIGRDTGKYCYSVKDTILALEQGAVEHLLLWESLAGTRFELRNRETGEEIVLYVSKEEGGPKEDYEVLKEEDLFDWIIRCYKEFGCNLELISDQTGPGAQFVVGFGGIGGILRWEVNFISGEEEFGDSLSDGETSNANGYDFEDGDFGF